MDNYSNRNKGCQNYHRPIRISNTSESRNAASRNGKRETNSNFLLCKHAPSLFADANLDASILSDARYGYKRGRGGGDRGKTRNAAESFVADYRSIFEQVHSTGLSPSLSGNLFFTRLPRQSFPRYVPHFSPRKNPFSGARYVRRRGSSGALPPPCSSSTSLFLSLYALYPLRDS